MSHWKPALTNPKLLANVIRKIDDDQPRLIFADWLERRGAPESADFIRVQCALAKSRPSDDDYCDLVDRGREVLARMCKKGTYDLGGSKYTKSYSLDGSWLPFNGLRRGFPFWIREPADKHLRDEKAAALRFREALPDLMTQTTARGLKFYGWFSRQLDTILDTPVAGKLTALEVFNAINDSPPVDTVEAILSSPIADSLESLDIMDLYGSQMSKLAKSKKLKRMSRLHLSSPEDDPTAVTRMISADWFQGMRDIEIGIGNRSTARSLRALSRSKNLRTARLPRTPITEESRGLRFENLSRLSLFKTSLTSTGMKLLTTWSLPNLRVFESGSCGIKSSAIKNLARANWARQLRVLLLHSNRLDNKSISLLAESGILREMRDLSLGSNVMTAAGLLPLANEKVMPELTTLSLNAPEEKYLIATETEMVRFLSKISVPKLRHLDLSGWPLGDRGAQALASNPSFANLRSLSLEQCGIGQKATEAICESPYLANLLKLSLTYNHIGAVLQPLRSRKVLPHLCRLEAKTLGEGTPEKVRNAFGKTLHLVWTRRPEIWF